MSQSKLVLVTGATGNQGGSVVDALLRRGHQVRALTRKADSPAANQLRQQGVELAVGDFTNRDSLVRAARGVDALYAMGTPFGGIEQEVEQGKAIADAAKAAGVTHLVYSSVDSADRATGIPHFDSKYKVEQYIQASGMPYTIVAPAYFMDNLLQPWLLAGVRQGTLAMALPAHRSLQQIAVADIGEFVASVIDRGHSVFGRRYNIAGDDLNGQEAAAILSRVTGRTIHYQGFPPEVLRKQSEEMALMFEWFDKVGYASDIAGLRRDFPEVGWRTFEAWVGKQDWRTLEQS
ncbi:MAG: NmrA/HSCARG family protein [Caldilineaceae bacterium]